MSLSNIIGIVFAILVIGVLSYDIVDYWKKLVKDRRDKKVLKGKPSTLDEGREQSD